MRRLPDPETERIKDQLRDIEFPASAVHPQIMASFQYTDSPIEWFSIDSYSTYEKILKRVEKAGKILASASEFISEVSRMKDFKDILICLIDIEGLGKGFLTASIDIQREICSIFVGEGFAPCCKFAVKPHP